jgi:hypothetical protein
MERTIPIGLNILAKLGNDKYFTGRWQDVKITKVSEKRKKKRKDLPLFIRKSLVGLIIPTVFSQEQLELQNADITIPDNSRLAYISDIIEALRTAKKYKKAQQLEKIAPEDLHMYVIEEEIYSLV